MQQIFTEDRGLIVALDVDTIPKATVVADAMRGVPKVVGFKLGFELGYEGLAAAVLGVRTAYSHPTKIIFDHQKGGNDIPEMGVRFAKKMRQTGVDAAILFPFVGPVSLEAWVKALQDEGIGIMVGFVMTHKGFLASEGGSLPGIAYRDVFGQACKLGVTDFVVPGNRENWISTIREEIELHHEPGQYTLSAPGFVTQGGDISAAGAVAGPRFNPIVGSGIYGQPTPLAMHTAAHQLGGNL
jgi:orotidine-5'-phosphate decarboxylase